MRDVYKKKKTTTEEERKEQMMKGYCEGDFKVLCKGSSLNNLTLESRTIGLEEDQSVYGGESSPDWLAAKEIQ